MNIRPSVWTHHHVKRLYHISLMAVFLFSFAVAAWGIFFILGVGQADSTAFPPETISVSAVVPEVSGSTTTPVTNEPVIAVGGPSARVPGSFPPGKPAPELTVFPEEFRSKSSGSGSALLYVVGERQPVFLGLTSIPNAYVIFQIFDKKGVFLQATVSADETGHFRWLVDYPLSEGLYSVLVQAVSPSGPRLWVSYPLFLYRFQEGLAAQPVPLPLPSPPQAFVSLPLLFVKTDSATHNVRPSQPVSVKTILQGFGSASKPALVTVDYFITNTAGATKEAGSEKYVVPGSAAYAKLFYPAIDARPGTYVVTAKVSWSGYILVANDTFAVLSAPGQSISIMTFDRSRVLDGFVLLLLLFLILAYMELRHVRRHGRKIRDQAPV